MHQQSQLHGADHGHVVSVLNSFLRGEISAVETYRQAWERLRTSPYAATIEQCMRSHEDRMNLLTQEVARHGGTPSTGSGPWGSFAKLVEGSATALGDKAAIYALEEGEDHGRNDYQRDIDKLDPSTQEFVRTRLLAEQLRTHDAISALKKQLH